MSWTGLALATVALALMTILPGYSIARLFRIPRLVGLGASPVLGLGIFAIFAHVYSALGIRWGMASIIPVGLALGGLAVFVSHRRGEISFLTWTGLEKRQFLAVALGTVVGGGLQAFSFLRALVVPNAVRVGWDGVYHLSGVRAVIETGDASVFAMSRLYQDGEGVFYPTGFHSLAGLLPWVDVEVALNSTVIFASAIAVPLGTAVLATEVFKKYPAIAFAAPIYSVWMLSLVGVVFGQRAALPAGLAASLVPGALALIWYISFERLRLVHIVPSLLLIGGIVYAQPSVMVAVGLFSIPPLLLGQGPTLWKVTFGGSKPILVGVGFVAGFAVVVVSYILTHPRVQSVANYPRAKHLEDNWERLGAVLIDESVQFGPGVNSWLIIMLVLVGAVFAMAWRKSIAFVAAWIFCVVLAMGAMKVQWWGSVFTGFFYNDFPRITAILPGFVGVLAGAGTVLAVLSIARILQKLRLNSTITGVISLALLVGTVAVVRDQTDNFREDIRVDLLAFKYFTPHSGKMNTVVETWDEIEYIRDLAEDLPDDAVIVGNPLGGVSMFYALGGIDSYPKAINTFRAGTAEYYLVHNFHDYLTDPAVCEAVRELGATHVYLKPETYAEGLGSSTGRPGFFDVPHDGLTLERAYTDKIGLWRIDACK